MQSIESLTQLISQFPGIGPRQAKRVVYALLSKEDYYLNSLAEEIKNLKSHVRLCTESYAYFYSHDTTETLHPIVKDATRNNDLLMVLEKDTDLEAMEKSHLYHGLYFILGGNLPVVEKDPQKRIRLSELKRRIEKQVPKEIIIAMNATPEGDNTADFLKKELDSFNIKLTILGRGLSTGTEIEYSDKETLENALNNRK